MIEKRETEEGEVMTMTRRRLGRETDNTRQAPEQGGHCQRSS